MNINIFGLSVECFDPDVFIDLECNEFFADCEKGWAFEWCFDGVVSDQAIVYHFMCLLVSNYKQN